ncbi:MAG: hypothetical protein M3Z40_03195, partial [Bifidobacterium sp.]|nr:hypothetical protein [Bifidobacterium sp.]
AEPVNKTSDTVFTYSNPEHLNNTISALSASHCSGHFKFPVRYYHTPESHQADSLFRLLPCSYGHPV